MSIFTATLYLQDTHEKVSKCWCVKWYLTPTQQCSDIPERICLHNCRAWPGDRLWRHLVISSLSSRDKLSCHQGHHGSLLTIDTWTMETITFYILRRVWRYLLSWLTWGLRRQEIRRWCGVRSIHLEDTNPSQYFMWAISCVSVSQWSNDEKNS